MQPLSSEHINYLKNKFNSFASSFLSKDKVCNDHIELKREHTHRVCDEMKFLAVQTGLSNEKTAIAYIIALFHDIGRFGQFCKYRTFDDSRSINHAALSVETIKSEGFFDNIPEKYHELIIKTILNHNIPYPDFSEDDEITFFSKLLRDADKLDIWNVITQDELRQVIEQDDEELIYEVPLQIFQRFVNREIVNMNLTNSVNDMRLMRISWVFDIYFNATFTEIKKRGLLEKIFQLIPPSEKVLDLKIIVREYIEKGIPINQNYNST